MLSIPTPDYCTERQPQKTAREMMLVTACMLCVLHVRFLLSGTCKDITKRHTGYELPCRGQQRLLPSVLAALVNISHSILAGTSITCMRDSSRVLVCCLFACCCQFMYLVSAETAHKKLEYVSEQHYTHTVTSTLHLCQCLGKPSCRADYI